MPNKGDPYHPHEPLEVLHKLHRHWLGLLHAKRLDGGAGFGRPARVAS